MLRHHKQQRVDCLLCVPTCRYGTVQGYSSFRRCLASFLSDATQHKVDPEELLITAGALALHLLLVLPPSNSHCFTAQQQHAGGMY
jgi:aspartate/methionine/tyrosine aminotransferase